MKDERSKRVIGRLKLSNTKLNRLLEITNAINSNASRETLFNQLRLVLVDELGIDKFALFTFEEHWRLSLTQGINEDKLSNVNIYHIVNHYKNIDVLHSAKEIGTDDFDIVVPVFHNKQAFAYLLLADLNGEKIEISTIIKHLKFIQTLANIIVVALENKRLYKEEMKQISFKKELEMAQAMQELLFPKKLPNNEELKVKAFYLPHSEVGGDYYDFVELSDGRKAICVADVSGKGMSAAILMANFQANLRALISTISTLEDLVEQLNQRIINTVQFEKFITLFIAIYNPKSQELSYLNAGHQPAILVQNNKTKQLKTGSTILGMFEELPKVQSEKIRINATDKLICFTDGLSELEDKKGKQLDIEGIEELINPSQSLELIKEQIETKIDELEAQSGISDDVTFVLTEFLPQASS